MNMMLFIFFSKIAKYFYNSKDNTPKTMREEENRQTVYRITYYEKEEDFNLILMNSSLVVIAVVSILTCGYIDRKIIKPFSEINKMPYELAKENLNIPLKEQKNKYFGKFTWGMDMLRENLEDNKKRELNYQKEKKTLILSLSHDIKTPLSAIKLYARALKDNFHYID